jgi:hypothetical protein
MGYKILSKGNVVINEDKYDVGVIKYRLIEVDNYGKIEKYKMCRYILNGEDIRFYIEDDNGNEIGDNNMSQFLGEYVGFE